MCSAVRTVSKIIDASGFYLTDLNRIVAAVEANRAYCSSVPVLMKSPFSGWLTVKARHTVRVVVCVQCG